VAAARFVGPGAFKSKASLNPRSWEVLVDKVE
jgi:hypothetical protein